MVDKIEMGKTYRMRDGRDVTIDRVDGSHGDMPVEFRVIGSSVTYHRPANGRWRVAGGDHPFDLIEVTEARDTADKIEMGKTYRTRDGQSFELDRVDAPYANTPVEGRTGGLSTKFHWCEDGRWAPGRDDHPLDLIEVKETTMADVIRIEKTYRTRTGQDVQLIRVDGLVRGYPVEGFVGGMRYSWTKIGHQGSANDLLPLDLIEVKDHISTKDHEFVDPAEHDRAYSAVDNVDTTLDQREATHGDFAERARIVQGIKELMMTGPAWADMSSAQRQSLDMNADKISRIVCGNPNEPDHWHDIEGYARLVSKELVRADDKIHLEVRHTPEDAARIKADVLIGEKKTVYKDFLKYKNEEESR